MLLVLICIVFLLNSYIFKLFIINVFKVVIIKVWVFYCMVSYIKSKRGIRFVIRWEGELCRKGVLKIYGKWESEWGIILNWLSVLVVKMLIILMRISRVFKVSKIWSWIDSGFIICFFL